MSAIGSVQNTVKAAPGTALQGVDHDECQDRQDDDADEQHTNAGDGAGDGAHFRANHVAQGSAVAASRQEQHSHILDRAREHDADENPQRAGQIAHLRREHRPDQRAGASYGREMMSEEHVAIGRHVIEAVVATIGGRLSRRVHAQHLVGDEKTVEPIRDEVDTRRRDDEPCGIDGLAAR